MEAKLLIDNQWIDAQDGAVFERLHPVSQEVVTLAAAHLAARGLRIVARNVRCRGGEVDLICLDRSHVVFVEVRLRTSARFGGAAESITAAKRRRVLIAAQWWLGGAGRRFAGAACRFDAVLLDALDPERITWLPGAFDAG